MSRTRAEQRRDRSRVPSRLAETLPSRVPPLKPFPVYVQATYTRAASPDRPRRGKKAI